MPKKKRVNEKNIQKLIIVLCGVLFVLVVFELGVLVSHKYMKSEPQVVDNTDYQLQILQLQQAISQKEEELANLKSDNEDFDAERDRLLESIKGLRSEVNDLQKESGKNESDYPFIVPTTGIVGSQNGTFEGQIYDMEHLGIDIWTTTVNSGRQDDHKGNPVYAACTGVVGNLDPENGGFTVNCDEIPEGYNVPHRDVYTYYGHMGHAESKELYYTVKRGDRIEAGDFLGFQGDLSKFFPDMRNIHLHFSVFTGKGETDPNGGAIDACLYIGGVCTKQGEKFIAGVNKSV